ncbi:MAG: hypothetical protein U0Q11_17515 [Vicinamibacterales bacterium]
MARLALRGVARDDELFLGALALGDLGVSARESWIFDALLEFIARLQQLALVRARSSSSSGVLQHVLDVAGHQVTKGSAVWLGASRMAELRVTSSQVAAISPMGASVPAHSGMTTTMAFAESAASTTFTCSSNSRSRASRLGGGQTIGVETPPSAGDDVRRHRHDASWRPLAGRHRQVHLSRSRTLGLHGNAQR